MNPDNLFYMLVRDFGLPGVLLIIIILLVENPDRGERLKAVFLKPFFDLFKLASRQYIAARVGSTSTEFLRTHISRLVSSIPQPTIKIKWVRSPSDPVFQKDGTLIVRLKETNDQARNILAATRVALPRVVCPLLRSNMEHYAGSAIDLTILKSLSEKLGSHARILFQQYFLNPEVDEDNRAAALFANLVALDESGIFISVFLEELNQFGEKLFAMGDTTDKTTEIVSFLEYLLKLARKERGQEVLHDFFSANFKICIMLLAISWKTQTQGMLPYLRRIDKYLKSGCDSVYIVCYPQAWSFLRRLTDSLGKDPRLDRIKWNNVSPRTSLADKDQGFAEIVLYHRNAVFEDNPISEKINELGIRKGSIVEGRVFDVSKYSAMVDLGGLYGVVLLEDSSWREQLDCADVLGQDMEYPFLVNGINFEKNFVELSRKVPEEDPWKRCKIPSRGETIQVQVRFFKDGFFVCATEEGLETILPEGEVRWGTENVQDAILGTRQKVVVQNLSPMSKRIAVSIKKLAQDPWANVQNDFPQGKRVTATVDIVEPNNVTVKLRNGLRGYIPRQYVTEAGRNYGEFRGTVKPGQLIDVVVSKVFASKRTIRLMLVPKHQKPL
jgi:hypothetical protein